MTEEGRAKGLSPEDVLRPANFLSYVRATMTALRSVGRSIVVPFLGLAVALTVADIVVTLSLEAGASRAGMRVAILFALPLFGSILVARSARVIAPALAGQEVSFHRAGRDLRDSLPHLVAAAMIATFLTFLLTQVNQLLALVAPVILIGPPILAQVLGLERKALGDAWRRSRELVAGHALRVFVYLFLAALTVVMFRLVLTGLVFTLSSGLGDAGLLVATATYTILTGLILTFMAAFSLVAYLDCRTRTEEYDLEDLRQGEQEAPHDRPDEPSEDP